MGSLSGASHLSGGAAGAHPDRKASGQQPPLPCGVRQLGGRTSTQTQCSWMAPETLGWAPWRQSVQGLQGQSES